VQMKNVVIGLGVAAVAAAAGVACSSSSSPVTTTVEDSGTPVVDSGNAVVDSGGSTPADAGDAGVACNPGATLYDRLGGHDGIHSALAAIVQNELADPDIVTYFFNQLGATVPAGHPTDGQIEECFTVLLASVAGGPYTYPPDGGVIVGDAGAFMCRNMMTIHQPLEISGGTFDQFVSIAASTLAPSVCAADLAMIGSALEGTKPVIVYPTLADAGLQKFPNFPQDGGVEQ
jgi:hypothetical protein